MRSDRAHNDRDNGDPPCREHEVKLKAYMDGELGVGEQAHVWLHLHRCSRCREARDAMTEISRRLAAAQPDTLDASLRERILSSVPYRDSRQFAKAGRPARFGRSYRVLVLGSVTAATVILIAVTRPRSTFDNPVDAGPSAAITAPGAWSTQGRMTNSYVPMGSPAPVKSDPGGGPPGAAGEINLSQAAKSSEHVPPVADFSSSNVQSEKPKASARWQANQPDLRRQMLSGSAPTHGEAQAATRSDRPAPSMSQKVKSRSGAGREAEKARLKADRSGSGPHVQSQRAK